MTAARVDGGGVGGGDQVGLAEVLGPQHLLDGGGLAGDVPAALQRRADLADRQLRRGGRGGGLNQQLQHRVRCQAERLVGRKSGGEVVPQRHPQPQHVPRPFPQQCLMRSSDDLDGLGDLGVSRDLPQLVAAGADHVRERMGVALVALGPRGPEDLPVPGRLLGIDPEHPVPRRPQRPHPRAPVGLDTHQHL